MVNGVPGERASVVLPGNALSRDPANAPGSDVQADDDAWIHHWIDQLFEDVALLDGTAQPAASGRVLVLFALVDETGPVWFSTPLSWSEDQTLSLGGLFPFARQALEVDQQRHGRDGYSVHRLVLGPRARLRHFGTPLETGTALGGLTTSRKTITAVVPRHGVGMILKQSPMVTNLLREVEALSECPDGLLAPRHLGQVSTQGSGLITLQTLLPGQPLEWAGGVTPEQELAVIDGLRRLVRPERSTSCLEQARSLQGELATAPLPPDERATLERLLIGIDDDTRWPASRLHGDLRPMNLQVCPLERDGDRWRCGIGLLDWEFSRPSGLGVTDYLRLQLDRAYLESRSFAELLQPSRLELLQQRLSRLDLPGADGPLDQPLRLHVVTHALDRLVSFGDATGIRMTNLKSMLASPWPL